MGGGEEGNKFRQDFDKTHTHSTQQGRVEERGGGREEEEEEEEEYFQDKWHLSRRPCFYGLLIPEPNICFMSKIWPNYREKRVKTTIFTPIVVQDRIILNWFFCNNNNKKKTCPT